MKRLILCFALALSACASTPPPKPQGFILPPALSETFRGGALKGLEHADQADLGIPNQYDLTTHVCQSAPIFDIWGRFVRTDVRCW